MATVTTSDGLADATGIATHAAETPGMPQLNFDHWGNQIFWLILALIATYLILSRVALPRIGAVLAERQGTITNDIAAAEDLKVKAQEAEAAYDKALIDALTEHFPGLKTEVVNIPMPTPPPKPATPAGAIAPPAGPLRPAPSGP